MAPPGRSRLPVSTLRTSTSQDASVPKAWVQVPIRPYTAAVGAAASSAAMRRMTAASMPQPGATTSGENGSARARTLVQAGHVRADMGAGVGQAGLEQGVDHPHEQQRVPAWAHREPFVGLLRGAAAAGVDDHELARHGPASPRAARGSQAPCRGCRSRRTGWHPSMSR